MGKPETQGTLIIRYRPFRRAKGDRMAQRSRHFEQSGTYVILNGAERSEESEAATVAISN